MKRIRFFMLIVLLAALALPGCQQEPAVPENLSFPGTQWNMSPQELVQALHLEEGTYEVSETPFNGTDLTNPDEQKGTYRLIVDSMEIFGAQGKVGFLFYDFNGDGTYGLSTVRVAYPNGTDMQAVKALMLEQYGAPTELSTTKYSADYREHVSFWESETSAVDFFTAKELEQYTAVHRSILAKSMDEDAVKQNLETHLDQLQSHKLSSIYWTDQAHTLYNMTEEQWEYDPYFLIFDTAISRYRQMLDIPQ